ncbi:MAG TPA: ProQ/FinO family protein [Hyphomicrobiaceae bacterium]|jgi:ProP effector
MKKPSIKDAYATIALLAATWPKCFSVEFAGRRPLKVGISKDIAAAAEGAITPAELESAMSVYCGHKAYLKKLKEGAARVDLDGDPAGTVTADQAANARRRIERIDQRQSARVRARGLAIEAAAQNTKAEAEAAKRAAEETKREAEVRAGKRRPLLRLPAGCSGHGRGVAATLP